MSEKVSLREYVDMRFNAMDTATALARENSKRELEKMNEVRAQLEAQRGTFATVEGLDALKDKVEELRRGGAGRDGRREGAQPYLDVALKVLLLIAAAYIALKFK